MLGDFQERLHTVERALSHCEVLLHCPCTLARIVRRGNRPYKLPHNATPERKPRCLTKTCSKFISSQATQLGRFASERTSCPGSNRWSASKRSEPSLRCIVFDSLGSPFFFRVSSDPISRRASPGSPRTATSPPACWPCWRC